MTDIIAKTLTSITDPDTGAIRVNMHTEGIVRGYDIDTGPRGFIPLSLPFRESTDRRLRLRVDFSGSVYHLLYPEQVGFVTELGLLRTLVEGKTIEEVLPIAPYPQYVSDVYRPYYATLRIDGGLLVTLISDRASGILDVELVAEEML